MDPPLLFLLPLLTFLLLLLLLRRGGGQKGPGLPPGPPALPLVGNLLQISPFRPLQSLLKLSDRYGPVLRVRLGGREVVVLRGPRAVREALVENAEAFAGRGRMATLESTFRGHGLVFSEGGRWRQLRRFSLAALRDLGLGGRSLERRVQEEAGLLLREMRDTRGQLFDPTPLLSCAVSNIICSIVFGKRFDYGDPEFQELLGMMGQTFQELSTPWAQLYEMGEPLLQFLPGPHTRIPRLLGRMRSFIARRVRKNMETLEPGSPPRDFIDCFLLQMEKEKGDPNSEFTLENLELTALNLFFAGTETVSSTLRFGLLLLMKHPHVQEQVVAELERVVGREQPPAVGHRPHMSYTEATIHEIQRVSDLLPLGVPHRVTRDTLFRGFLLPKGTDVYPLLSSVLQDPTAFPQPHTFDPHHFLTPDGRFQPNEAFVPFSAGKRLCLGEGLARTELFLFLTTLLQGLRLEPPLPPPALPCAPQLSGFANIPPPYRLRVHPR